MHQTPMPVIANCGPKLVAMATSLSTYGPPSNTGFLRPVQAHSPNSIPIGSAVLCTDDCGVAILYKGTPILPQKFAPSHVGCGSPSNTWLPGPPKSSTQMAARSVQPFLQGSLVWQTDQQTTLLGQ